MSSKSCADRLALYENVERLSEGPHGCAYTVRHKASQRLCTLRVVHWERLHAGSDELTDAIKGHVLAEAALTEHPNLATFVECFGAEDVDAHLTGSNHKSERAGAGCMCIVTANEGTTLERIIRANQEKGETLDEDRLWKWVHQAIVALGHLHANGVVHRNLCPASIFVDGNDDIKLGHFGVASMLTKMQSIEQNNVASVCYMSPETMHDGRVDAKSDIWALGCVLHELITLAHPFCLKEDLVLYDVQSNAPPRILKKEHDYSWYLRTLPRWLLQKEKAFRPAALDVYFHVVFNWKDYSTDQQGIPWVEENCVPWTEEQLNDEDAMLSFDAEAHIYAINCNVATWEEVRERASMAKTITMSHTPEEIGKDGLEPITRQGAALIAA